MRKLFVISLLTLLFAACQSNRQGQQGGNATDDSLQNAGAAISQADAPAAIKFDTVFYDLDALEIDCPDQTRDFFFTNTGGAPLVIEKVEASCSCLDVVYPKDPIAPGDSSKITMTLKMKQILSGQFYRSANVYTNASKEPTELILQGIKKYE
jgi:hypothetical protein